MPVDQAAEPEPVSKASVDAGVTQVFLSLLISSHKDIPFPISVSNFKDKYFGPALSAKELDLKKSSFKKVTPFLKGFDKKGVIKLKEVKGGDANIVSVNLKHAMFKDVSTLSEAAQASPPTPKPPPKAKAGSDVPKHVITSYYKPSGHVKDFMQVSGEPMTSKEVREWLDEYVKEWSLAQDANKRKIIVNDPMKANVYGKRASMVPEKVDRDAFLGEYV